MTCALELRLYLERATLVATHQKARSLVDEVAFSSSYSPLAHRSS